MVKEVKEVFKRVTTVVTVPPYISVIEKLKELRTIKHPLKKLKIIFEAKQLITSEIDSFWKIREQKKHKQLTLDADQITHIFSFVVMKSGLTDIVAHIQLIEDFTTADQ